MFSAFGVWHFQSYILGSRTALRHRVPLLHDLYNGFIWFTAICRDKCGVENDSLSAFTLDYMSSNDVCLANLLRISCSGALGQITWWKDMKQGIYSLRWTTFDRVTLQVRYPLYWLWRFPYWRPPACLPHASRIGGLPH